MRKQTKLVAVLSTAALLAIGASMTSFAAQGWAEEDGTWVYYNKDGDKATDSWKKSGDNWYWLDDSGEMATDMLVEDDDNYYYVDANGAMVTNQWVAIENEDAGEDDEPDHYWYYFQANGKAFKRSDNSTTISAKTINGKKYAFDTDGKMLYGWVNSSFERDDDDQAWQSCLYYLGGEDDGALRSNEWALISIVDDQADKAQPGDDYWDEDQERWFFFQSSGKKKAADPGENYTDKKINGKKYGFDEYGRMVASWYTTLQEVDKNSTASNASSSIVSQQGTKGYTESFMYFSNPEDGARYTKGWFKVVPGYYLQQGKYEDDSDYWYYADGDGNLVANEVKRIKGKKYGFDEYGRMINGLALLQMSNETTIDKKWADDNTDGYAYDTEAHFNETVAKLVAGDDGYSINATSGNTFKFYYFGGADDGAMKTGKQTVNLDGDNFTFKFETKSALKGAGITGIDDDKFYLGGKLVQAEKEDKVMIVKLANVSDGIVAGDTSDDGEVKIDIKEFIDTFCTTDYDNPLGESNGGKKNARTWTVSATKTDTDGATASAYRVVNSSGSVAKGKTLKDGDDFKITVDSNKHITKIVVED